MPCPEAALIMMQPEVIGLVPMAGRATRLAPLPFSKELYPVVPSHRASNPRPRVISQFLLERMRSAVIRKAFLVIRGGKWDIPAYYNDGAALLDMHLAYVMAHLPYGPPFSLDAAFPFVSESTVAMGFPDILFGPGDVFRHLLRRHAGTEADLVLGLFRLPDSVVDDRVELDEEGRVRRYFLNQALSHLPYSWVAAVWGPRFTRFMHEHLREQLRNAEAPAQELNMGHVVGAAVDAGLVVQSVAFPDGRFLDIGTPTGLRGMSEFLEREESMK